jgi:hypothetical protein
MSMMERMMGGMMDRMSREEKEAMMTKMMDKFFAELTPEDKRKMMADMMPKMMTGMMDAGGECGNPMMAGMMEQMMPHCLSMMLPKLPKEKRADFLLRLVDILIEKGCEGMSLEEQGDFLAKIVEKAQG